MTAHLAAPNIQLEHNLLPNQPFFSWLRTQTTLFISQIIGILGFVTGLVSLLYYSTHMAPSEHGAQFISPRNIKLLIDYAHIALIVVFIIVLIGVLEDNERGSYRVNLVFQRVFGKEPSEHESWLKESQNRLRDFKRWFLGFWSAMLLLYVAFACQHSLEPAPQTHDRSSTVGNISIHGEQVTVMVGPGADVVVRAADKGLTPPQSGSGSNVEEPETHPRLERSLSILGLALNNISLSFVFGCFIVLYLARRAEESSKTKWRLVCGFLLVVLLLTGVSLLPPEAFNHVPVLEAASGIANAITFSLLIARLDSKLIGLHSRLVCVLYSYAAIQPFFVIFGSKPDELQTIQTAVLIVAFISKVYFFLIVIYVLQTGRMLNYFYCLPKLREQADSVYGKASRGQSVFFRPKNISKLFSKMIRLFGAVGFRGKGSETSILAEQEASPPSEKDILNASAEGAEGDEVSNPLAHKQSVFSRLMDQLGTVFSEMQSISSRGKRTETANVTVVQETSPPGSSAQVDESIVNGRNQSFFDWLRGDRGALILLWRGGLAALLVLLILPFFLKEHRQASLAVYFMHLLFLAIIIYLLIVKWSEKKAKARNETESIESSSDSWELACLYNSVFNEKLDEEKCKSVLKADNTKIRQFLGYFLCFWVCTLLLYGSFAAQALFQKPLAHNPEASAPGPGEEQATERILPLEEAAPKLVFRFLTFALNNAGMSFIFCCFVVLYLPSDDKRWEDRQKLLINYSRLVVVLLTLSFWLYLSLIELHESKLDFYSTYFAAMSGALNAVALSLLIARLDSKLMGIPSPLIVVLYFYSAVQPLFVLFDLDVKELNFKPIQLSALILAFALKIYFFLMVTYTVETRRMFNYLACFPFLNRRVEAIFDNQFEIKVHREKEGSFRYSILKKNALIYFTDTTIRSREECDETIHDLQVRMKDPDAYVRQEKNGTHWVKITVSESGPYSTICQSIGLRSLDEVNVLVDESTEKIPYCKYDRG